MSQEEEFLNIAIAIFRIFVQGLLPIAGTVIFFVYMKKIITTFIETHRMKLAAKPPERK